MTFKPVGGAASRAEHPRHDRHRITCRYADERPR
jgi:hypothetical protein